MAQLRLFASRIRHSQRPAERVDWANFVAAALRPAVGRACFEGVHLDSVTVQVSADVAVVTSLARDVRASYRRAICDGSVAYR